MMANYLPYLHLSIKISCCQVFQIHTGRCSKCATFYGLWLLNLTKTPTQYDQPVTEQFSCTRQVTRARTTSKPIQK